MMPYQGFVDSQVMSLFNFLSRGYVKTLYNCPFFADNKESGLEQNSEQRGWFPAAEKVFSVISV